MTALRRIALALMLLSLPWPVRAQDYPSRPIRVIAVTSAGVPRRDCPFQVVGKDVKANFGSDIG